MTRDCIRLGLIGWPLQHSLSPALHEAAFDALGLAGEYRLYPVPPLPAGEARLRELLEQVRTGELAGLNVTIPHKQAVLARLDRLTPLAGGIGAANTIFRQDGYLTGDNTDAPGFSASLRAFAAGWPEASPDRDAAPKRALVLGAGGSARAVVYALVAEGWEISIASRRIEQAEALAAGLERDSRRSRPVQAARLDLPGVSGLLAGAPIALIVNTTPVGMAPHADADASPWPPGAGFPPGAAVYDLVYQPAVTALVRAARAAGLPAVTGLGMLVEQAALAFERWTGQAAPREAMHARTARAAAREETRSTEWRNACRSDS